MPALDPSQLDLPALAVLAGAAANDHQLSELHDRGFPGMRVAHGWVIQNLVNHNPTIGELASRLAVTQQAASKVVLDLEKLGIVERRVDPEDSRVRRVALTHRGQAVLQASRDIRNRLNEAVAADMGEDLQVAKRALVSLLDHSGGREAVIHRRAKLPRD